MRRHGAVKYVLLSGLILAAVSAAIVGIRKAPAQSMQAEPRNSDTAAGRAEARALIDALRRGGVREAAKLKGHYVDEYDPYGDWMDYDTEKLTKYSDAVVVVLGRDVGGRLTPDGDRIITNYEVEVQEVIKGKPLGRYITVSMPGGRVQFEDGTGAELKAIDFESVKAGQTYTFFLSEGSAGRSTFVLTAGPRGVLETPHRGKVRSLARQTDAITKETQDKDTASFLQEVRALVDRWPLRLKCCSQ